MNIRTLTGANVVGLLVTLVLIRGSDSPAHVELGREATTEAASP